MNNHCFARIGFAPTRVFFRERLTIFGPVDMILRKSGDGPERVMLDG